MRKVSDMTTTRNSSADNSRLDSFVEAARELSCDKDEKRWQDRLRKVAAQKPSRSKGD